MTNIKHTVPLVEPGIRQDSFLVENDTGKKELPPNILLDKHQGALKLDANQRTTCINGTESKRVMEPLDDGIVSRNGILETSNDSRKLRKTVSQTQGEEIDDSLNKNVRGIKWNSGTDVQGKDYKKSTSHSSDSEGFSSTASSDSEFSDSDSGYALRLR